jgi:hypothetical protein
MQVNGQIYVTDALPQGKGAPELDRRLVKPRDGKIYRFVTTIY